MKKLPPIEKIYEAWSALADRRVEEDSGSEAECEAKNTENWTASQGAAYVFSSDGSKVYRVTWKHAVYTSNGNASYWQGYFADVVHCVRFPLF